MHQWHAALVEASLQNFRENRDETARWLAVEVLLADPVALEDDELVNRLHTLQDRLEELTRAKYGVAQVNRGEDGNPGA